MCWDFCFFRKLVLRARVACTNGVATLFIMAFLAATASATVIQVTNRATFGGTDYVAWVGDELSNLSSPYSIQSNLSKAIVVSTSDQNDFTLFTQGSAWNGCFALGDQLLGSGTALTIDFGSNVSGMVTQIQADPYGPFTAQISAYDSSNVQLATFSVSGISSGNGDNSAAVIGLLDSTDSIRKVELVVTASASSSLFFAINRLDFKNSSPDPSVPEPTSLAIFGLGSLAFAFSKRRKK